MGTQTVTGRTKIKNFDVILDLAAKGGGLRLYGTRSEAGWSFKLVVNDCVLDNDEVEAGSTAPTITPAVTSWEDALALLDYYLWADMFPLAIHPEFRTEVWRQVQRRFNGKYSPVNEWRTICKIDTQDWLDGYYDALEFFYWEPQHMIPNGLSGTRKVDNVKTHLRKMEVTLNHNMRQFFLLAPETLRNLLFRHLFGNSFDTSFALSGRDTDREFPIAGCMQPDFLFTATREVVSIEMKLQAKCSIEQVMKYALLGLAVEIKEAALKQHYLVLLGKTHLSSMFSPRIDSIEMLKNALLNADLPSFLKDKPRHLKDRQERFFQIVNEMQIVFITYDDLAQMLWGSVPREADKSAGAEVYRNLVSGLVAEFKRRELLPEWHRTRP